MEYVMRKAKLADLEGLDKVMMVISDGPGDKEKMVKLVERITNNELKTNLTALMS